MQEHLKVLDTLELLKEVYRQTSSLNQKRSENSAEHSWQLAMSVLLFSEYSDNKVNLDKCIKMALLHDIVEVFAGDTFIYADVSDADQYEQESKALDQVFAPIEDSELSKELKSIWHEFEKEESNEAKYVKALDRFLPIYINSKTDWHSWRKHSIKKEQILERNGKIKKGSSKLWDYTLSLVSKAEDEGVFK